MLTLLAASSCVGPTRELAPIPDFTEIADVEEFTWLVACNLAQGGSKRSVEQSREGVPKSVLASDRRAVRRRSTDWRSYQTLGQHHIGRGEFEKAAGIYQRYPPFTDVERSRDRSVDARNAVAAGSEIFFRGDEENARALFGAAAWLAPEAPAGLISHFYLAVLREDWAVAVRMAELRLQRCTGGDAIQDLISTLHVVGRSERAWALFDASTRLANAPPLLSEALIGLRIEGRSDHAIVVWLTDDDRRLSGMHLPSYAIRALLQDRPPSDVWGGQLQAVYRNMLMGDPKMAGLDMSPEQIQAFVRPASETNVRFVEAYADWKRGHFVPAWKNFLRALKPRQPRLAGPAWIQPYLAWSAIESGQTRALERHLERVTADFTQMSIGNPAFDPRSATFTTQLVSAVRAGLAGDHEAAQVFLRRALDLRAPTAGRIMSTWYQAAELCEALYLATEHRGYRILLLDLSRRHTRAQPMFAWSWAVVARYSKSAEERQRALRSAYYLDPRSARLFDVPQADLSAARNWLEQHHPFAAN